MSCPPARVCTLRFPDVSDSQPPAAEGGNAGSESPQQICSAQSSAALLPPPVARRSASATLRSARPSARKSASSVGRSHSRYAADARTSGEASEYESRSASEAATKEPGAMRPATCSRCGGEPAACRWSATSAASIPPIDQPTRTIAEPAASAAMRAASSSIISASASAAAAACIPAGAASPGHVWSASAPLPGVSTPTTSIHSGAPAASSANAAVEPPAKARQ
mmetsp:Transcript_33482/g.111727  ORF Transcript_33482/g.111727 Transcript_33482/m.111727 type:complete len:224 (-) Transcript_33482:9-680(-)